MMIVKPDLDLPDQLELCCPQDIIDWIGSKLKGLKYIAIKTYDERQKYNQFARINIQENPSPTSMPEEKADQICDMIYRVLQYKADELDASTNFLIQTYNKSLAGDKASNKHVTVSTNAGGDKESKPYSPDNVDGNLLDSQMTYIKMLQDNAANLLAMMTNVFQPVLESNKQLQAELAANRQENYQIRNLEYTHKVWEKEQEQQYLLEQARLKASKDKWDSALKTINKNGAFDKIMLQAADKFLGSGNSQPALEQPKQPIRREPPQSQPVYAPPAEPSKKSEQEILEENRKIAAEAMRTSPLYTLCSYLKDSLDNEIIENPEDNAKKYIEETLRSSLYKDLMDLLNSENEEDAKKNLLQLRNTFDAALDFEGLMEVRNRLDETQKNIIEKILNYNPEE